MPHSLDALEKDIIREVLNIGLARAADSFALIAQGRVLLTVPDFDLVPASRVLALAKQYDSDHYFVVQSDIRGDFKGATLLAFSPEHIQRVTEICLRMKGPATLEINEMQRSLLLEISNILTGAMVTQIANLLHKAIYGAPPTTPGADLGMSLHSVIEASGDQVQPMVFTVVTQFEESSKEIELPLLIFFDRPTFDKIVVTIRSEEFRKASHL